MKEKVKSFRNYMALIEFQCEQQILKTKGRPYWETIEPDGRINNVKYKRVIPKPKKK